MEKQIFDIGRGRYVFDAKTLDYFIEEASSRRCQGESRAPVQEKDAGPAGKPTEDEMNSVFVEIVSLYREYLRCQSLDVLLKLKTRLQEYSVRYQSHVLAEEVLHINSCLPYELRVPISTMQHQ